MYEELVLELPVSSVESSASGVDKVPSRRIASISHNSVLNCLFILTHDHKLVLYDCNTGLRVKCIDWLKLNHSQRFDFLQVHNIQEKCIVVSDKTVCSRLSYDGKFLLDTVFQSATPNLSQTCNLSNHVQLSTSLLLSATGGAHGALAAGGAGGGAGVVNSLAPFYSTLSTSAVSAYLNTQTLSNSNNYNLNDLRTLELTLNESLVLLSALKQLEMNPSIGGGGGIDSGGSFSLISIIEQLEEQIKKLNYGNQESCDSFVDRASMIGLGGGGGSGDLNDLACGSDAEWMVVNSWTTVRLTDTYQYLVNTFTQSLEDLKRTNMQSLAIPVLASLLDRLYRLDSTLIESHLLNAQLTNSASAAGGGNVVGGAFSNYDKRYMSSEVTRRATFAEWPHMDYKWVLPDALAQAGFYHQPTHPGDDRTVCFVCDLCLVAWEQHDQPWSEHERHSPICQYVQGDITENVSLAQTTSTQPAQQAFRLPNESHETIVCTSELSSERYFAVSNASGHIIVYDSKDMLKEMMHVQLINESQHNKDQRLRIHSLCFYYRNHKHVLYGSFTIGDELFIFSFNIFDIYRSYHSKSNKKSSKSASAGPVSNATPTTTNAMMGGNSIKPSVKSSSKNSSVPKATPTIAAATTTTTNSVTPSATTTTTAISEISDTATTPAPITTTQDSKETSQPETNGQKADQTDSIKPEGIINDFSKYINNIIKIENSAVLGSNDSNSTPAGAAQTASSAPNKLLSGGSGNSNAVASTSSSTNYLENVFSMINNDLKLAQQQQVLVANNPAIASTFNSSSNRNMMAFGGQSNSHGGKHIDVNLSNFLNVRFEVCPSNNSSIPQPQSQQQQALQQQMSTSSSDLPPLAQTPVPQTPPSSAAAVKASTPPIPLTSSSSKKYKKSIKIMSVSCKRLNSIDQADIQLKNYEFTEKCLSFRLATIDLNLNTINMQNGVQMQPPLKREDIDIKLVNFYERYLCAMVNFRLGEQTYSKIYRIKHEDTTTTTTGSVTSTLHTVATAPALASLSTPSSAGIMNSELTQSTPPVTNGGINGTPSCLAATSSSRLNLTELLLPPCATGSRIRSIVPISITTLDEDNDLKFLAMLDDSGCIRVIDLGSTMNNKCSQVAQFSLSEPMRPDDRFVNMVYCYGIDKLCAWTAEGHIYFVQTTLENLLSSDPGTTTTASSFYTPVPLSLLITPDANYSILSSLKINGLESYSGSSDVNKKVAIINSETLEALHNLINLDSSKVSFSAKFPANWTPVLNEQHQQRKHPQHIHAESINFTKCWKYVSSTNGAGNSGLNSNGQPEDLNIEIYANKPLQIGAIQLKLKFNKWLSVGTNYELKLYRQRRAGGVEKEQSVDSVIDFNLDNRRELIYGPVNIRDYLDLTNSKTYTITICSSQLYETRSNLFYLSLRQTSSGGASTASSTGGSTGSHGQKYLQKIELTVRKYKKHNMENETLERLHMLKSKEFFAKLLDLLIKKEPESTKSSSNRVKVLDILNWILFNNLTNNVRSSEYVKMFLEGRRVEEDSNDTEKSDNDAKSYLDSTLILLLSSNRTVSKKLTMFFSLFLKIDSLNNKQTPFAHLLFDKLLELLDSAEFCEQIRTATSMSYYFFILNQLIISLDTSAANSGAKSYSHLFNKLISLVGTYYQKLESNQLFYSLLKIKSFTSGANLFPSSAHLNALNNIFEKDLFNIDDVYLKSSQLALVSLAAHTHQTAGLLETLPMTYRLITCSPATSIDKTVQPGVKASGPDQAGNFYYLPSTFITTMNSSSSAKTPSPPPPASIDTSLLNSIFNITSPIMQHLIVERMEPVSKHFAIIDFGMNVYLTDVILPACSEIASVSVDYWLQKEQKDSRRLLVSTSIAQHPVQLCDIQPPPVCRFVKLTFVSHSSNVVKARIPLGFYFGQPVQLDNTYSTHLRKLYEENKSKYIQSIGKLRDHLLNEIQYPNDNIGHLKLANLVLTSFSSTSSSTNEAHQMNSDLKLKEILNECVDHQFQLNLNRQLMIRLNDDSDTVSSPGVTQDKLKGLNQHILKTLICLTPDISSSSTGLTRMLAFNFFKHLCVYGGLEKECSLFLVKFCSRETWWGAFIADCLRYYFVGSDQVKEPLVLSRIFLILNEMCMKSLRLNSLDAASLTNNSEDENNTVDLNMLLFKSLFELVNSLLADEMSIDVSALEWLMLFLTRLLNLLSNSLKLTQSSNVASNNNRWEFLEKLNVNASLNSAAGMSGIKNKFINTSSGAIISVHPLSKSKFKKKLLHSSTLGGGIMSSSYSSSGAGSSSSSIYSSLNLSNKQFRVNKRKLEEYNKQFLLAQQHQHLQQQEQAKKMAQLPRDISLELGKSLARLLTQSINSYSSSDLFVLCCRVLSSLCLNTQPSLSLNELFDKNDLQRLIMLNVSLDFNHGSVCWGSPWSTHALLCLLADVVENESRSSNVTEMGGSDAMSNSTSSTTGVFSSGGGSDNSGSKTIVEEPGVQPSTSAAASTAITDIDLNNILIEEDEDSVQATSSNASGSGSTSSAAAAAVAAEALFKESDLKADLINNLMGTAMSKKFDEIKQNIVAPFQQMSTLFSAASSKFKSLYGVGYGASKLSHSPHFFSTLNTIGSSSQQPSSLDKYSFTYDMRLDTSIYQTLENELFIKVTHQNELINSTFDQLNNIQADSSSFVSSPTGIPLYSSNVKNESASKITPDVKPTLISIDPFGSTNLVQDTLEALFQDLNDINLENLFTFWLTLNNLPAQAQTTSTACQFPLKPASIHYMLDTLSNYPFMTVKLWHLTFKVLGILLNGIQSTTEFDPLLYKLVLRYMRSNASGHQSSLSDEKVLMGDECNQAFIDFLQKLVDRKSSASSSSTRLSLFNILNQLIDRSEIATIENRSIDSQVAFVEFIIDQQAVQGEPIIGEDHQLIENYLLNVARLIQHHLHVAPRLTFKGQLNPRSCFSSVLSTLLFGNVAGSSISNSGTSSSNTISGSSKSASIGVKSNAAKSSSSTIFDKNFRRHHASDTFTSLSKIKTQSVLCNQDLYICLLLKLGISLLEKIGRRTTSSKRPIQVKSQQQPSSSIILEEESEDMIDEECCYDDEEDENIDEVVVEDEDEDDFDHTTEYESDASSLRQQSEVFNWLLGGKSGNECLELLIESLALCQSSALAMVISNSGYPIEFTQDDIRTSGDGLFLLLKTIGQKIPGRLVEPCFAYLNKIKRLSEPLLWFLSSLFVDERFSQSFIIKKNGIDIISKGLSVTTRQLLYSGPCIISSVMNLIESERSILLSNINRASLSNNSLILLSGGQHGHLFGLKSQLNANSNSLNGLSSNNASLETDSGVESFTNFASLATITCSNPIGNPADILVHSNNSGGQSTSVGLGGGGGGGVGAGGTTSGLAGGGGGGGPVGGATSTHHHHRRMRSNIWSYHFQPDECKVSLSLTFPHAFLLKEIHIVPNTVSINNIPAYVSVEVSRDSSTRMMYPIGTPLCTMGLANIRFQLTKSELVQSLQINLYKAKDSMVVGLSQIRVLGYPMFENMLSAKPDMMLTPVEDLVARSNMGWLRLLHMCLQSSEADLSIIDRISDSTILLCVRLLASPAMIIYDKLIEQLLIKMSKHSKQKALFIVGNLLRSEHGANTPSQGMFSVPHGALMETLTNILYQICDELMSSSVETNNELIELLIDWLRDECFVRKRVPSHMLIHCVATIFYNQKNPTVKSKDGQLIIHDELILHLIEYSLSQASDFYTRQSINWLMCALLHQRPELIWLLTAQIEPLFDTEYKTDEKSTDQLYVSKMFKLLDTLSYAVQNIECVKLILGTPFFTSLTKSFLSLLDATKTNNSKLSKSIKYYLNVYMQLARYKPGQRWLGTDSMGRKLWQVLIHLLVNSSSNDNWSVVDDEFVDISLTCIKFLKTLLLAEKHVQSLFAEYLKALLVNYSQVTINSFLHQLLIQILLDEQYIMVNINKKLTPGSSSKSQSISIGTPSSQATSSSFANSLQSHPKRKISHLRGSSATPIRCSEMPMSRTMQQIIEMLDLITPLASSAVNITAKTPIPRLFIIDPLDGLEKYLPMEYSLERVLNVFLKRVDKLIQQSETQKLGDLEEQGLDLIAASCSEEELLANFEIFEDDEDDEDLVSSPLDAFVNCNGLIVLAERLPMLMPFIREPLLTITDKDRSVDSSGNKLANALAGGSQLAQQLPKISPDFVDYVIMNESDVGPFMDDMYNEMPIQTTATSMMNAALNGNLLGGNGGLFGNLGGMNGGKQLKKITMPVHSFIAFGLFLKIPGYAKCMLRSRKQAQCILKLLLGESTNNSSRYTSENVNVEEFGLGLSIMPFVALRDLLQDCLKSKLQNSEKVESLISFLHENNHLTLLLAILSILSHHPNRQKSPHFEANFISDIAQANSQATSSSAHHPPPTTSNASTSTNIFTILNEQFMMGGGAGGGISSVSNNEDKNNLYWAKGTGFGTGSTMQQWDAEKTLMQQKMEEEHVTCILEILSIYLDCCQQNMSDQIVELIDHSCVINALSSYLRNDSVLDMSRHIPLYRSSLKLLQTLILNERLRILIQECNILELIKNIKLFVDSYTQRIKLSEEESDFAILIPVLNETYELVVNFIKPENHDEDSNSSKQSKLISQNDAQNIEQIYCEMVKSLQFDTYSIVSETGVGVYKSNIPYYYESTLNGAQTNLNNSTRAKRLAQETVTLSNSLPVSYSSSVFVRCDEERLDVMKVLITGPTETPYENGCFEFDVFFPADYPDSPPLINLQTTGNQTVRFNPNLYHDGKVCLSILNTWHGRPEERWNQQTSSFLQVLVSIQSLILVSEPYFNEPGYERSRGTPAGTASSIEHDANIRQATVKWGMLEMIKKPPGCFKEIVHKHFYYKKKEVKEQCERWLKEMELHMSDKQIGQSVTKSCIALKRHMVQLFEILDQLKVDDDEEESNQEDVVSDGEKKED